MAITHAVIGSLVANIVLPLVAASGVALRFAARSKKHQPLKGDDWTILVALVCCLAVGCSSTWAAVTGVAGVPWNEMSQEQYISFRKVFFSDILILHFTYGIVKVSVILFYKRIFTVGRFIVVANIALAFVIGFILFSFFTVLLCARGVYTFWTTPPMLEGTQYVVDPPALITAYAVIDIVLDVGILALPLPLIMRLHMSKTKRFAVAGVFLLGAFCLVCSIVRLYYVRALFGFTGFDMKKQVDITEKNNLWAHIEAHASTFTACLPTLRPLFQDNRSVHSLVGSMRSKLSMRSQTSTEVSQNKSHSAHQDVSASEERDWIAMNAKGASAEVEAVHSSQRSNHGSVRSDTILVKKKFGVDEV